jgi:hypothetical protein
VVLAPGRAWTSWGQVRRHAAPRAWVVRTALNLGVSWWRRRRREVPLADHDAAVPAGPGDGVDPAPSTLPDGTDVMVINGAAMPPGTRLSIGYFAGHVRLLLIKDGAPLSCSSTSRQPAVHITPSGTPIRG